MSQWLARFQLAPRRRTASRRVGALKGTGRKPMSQQTSANNAKVHVLRGVPNVRGLWGNSPWTQSRVAASSTGWTVGGTLDCAVRQGNPCCAKACRALLDGLDTTADLGGHLGRGVALGTGQ